MKQKGRGNPKRLLILIYSLGVGGAETMVAELVKKIDKTRFSCSVLCISPKKHTFVEDWVESVCPVSYLGITGSLGVRQMLHAMAEIRKLKPDVLHAHLGSVAIALPYGMMFHKPVVVTIHTKPEEAFSRRNETLIRKALQKGIAYPVAVSPENLDLCREYFNLDRDCGTYVNNGVDMDRFFRREHERFTYINVATHNENKNQAMILRCFDRIHREHPQTSLLLLGEGPTHEKLLVLSQQLGLGGAVVFPGRVGDTENYYSQSDVYLQSSFVEALPMAILEAMASGLPVVSTDVGGIRDVVKGNGVLVPAGDEEAYYKAMKLLLDIDEETRSSMGIESYKCAEAYSSSAMASRYMEIYDARIE